MCTFRWTFQGKCECGMIFQAQRIRKPFATQTHHIIVHRIGIFISLTLSALHFAPKLDCPWQGFHEQKKTYCACVEPKIRSTYFLASQNISNCVNAMLDLIALKWNDIIWRKWLWISIEIPNELVRLSYIWRVEKSIKCLLYKKPPKQTIFYGINEQIRGDS